MANINFGVNILPKTNNTYTLGNSDYKWNIFANQINGINVTDILSNTTMTGATSSANGASGLVPAPTTTDVDKFLAGDGTYKSGGLPMVILSYGNSTWNDFINAYNNNVIVYCRASSNANPASGSQTRMAFMAYVDNATTPTNVEFQYYRSVSSHTNTQMSDQVFVYKLTNKDVWSVTTREAGIKKVVAGTGAEVSYNNNEVTVGVQSTPWELIREDNFTNETEDDHVITVDSNNTALDLLELVFMFETPRSSTTASAKGEYGQVQFFYGSGTNDYFASESGSWTQAVDTSAHGFIVKITQEPGGLFMCQETAQTTSTNSANWRSRFVGGLTGTSQGVRLLPNTRHFNKIIIKNVTGLGHYILIGKRAPAS